LTDCPEVIREYPAAPLVGVGAVVVEGGRVLLVRRGREPSKGDWSIPGGLVKVGERLKDALTREVREETGLEVEPGDLVELLERIFPDDAGGIRYHYILADYGCRMVGGELKAGSDVLAAVWVAREDLGEYNLARVTMDVIIKALDDSR